MNGPWETAELCANCRHLSENGRLCLGCGRIGTPFLETVQVRRRLVPSRINGSFFYRMGFRDPKFHWEYEGGSSAGPPDAGGSGSLSLPTTIALGIVTGFL